MKKITFLLFASFIGISATLQAQQDFSQVEMKTTQVAPNIYMLEGSGGNIGVFTGDDVAFIIDDQYAPLHSKIKAAVAAVTGLPISFVVNTHFHGDHAGSNANFEGDGAVIIAHENTYKKLHADQLEAIKGTDTKPAGLPKITFSESINFRFGEEEIEIYYHDRGHTAGDVIVYFKTSNVFHTGDAYVRYGIPFIDINNGGHINGMIATLNFTAGKMDYDAIIIPGHGELAKKQDLLDFRDMLMTIRNRVQSGITSNLSLEEIKASNPLEGFEDLGGIEKDTFVGVVYQNLTE